MAQKKPSEGLMAFLEFVKTLTLVFEILEWSVNHF